jgi:hypothetical protein
MPPAKKPAARRASRTSAKPSPTGPITRKEVEEASARFEKALEEANQALAAMREDLGKGARGAYKEVAASLKTLRRDAQKTSRGLIKDMERLRDSVATARSSTGATRKAARGAGKAAGRAAKSSTRSSTKSAARSTSRTTASKASANPTSKRSGARSRRGGSK